MSQTQELRLPEALRLSDAAEVALEDYAREVTRSQRASALRGPGPGATVEALLLEGLAAPLDEQALRDVMAFAHELAQADESAGLGWS